MLTEEQLPENFPERPVKFEDLGLPRGFMLDLTLKTLYTTGQMEGQTIADNLCLPFGNLVHPLLESLEEEQYVEVRGGGQFPDEWTFVITDAGRDRVGEIFEEDRYIGPAPVPLDQYSSVTKQYGVNREYISRSDLERAFDDLIVPEEYYEVFGPAVNSGKSVFVFGEPGNGKTVMCERIIEAFDDFVAIPHAVYAGGSVINFYDPSYHSPEEIADGTVDERWMVSRRPFVSVGGDLTMKELDLIYNDTVGFYEAPFQMKANTGVLLIDDFGRQQMDPEDLLNRWIVPLEKGIDYLTLHTGMKIQFPFEVLVFYSTNIDPNQLVDEAFLRRLRYKVHTENPSEKEFKQLFESECDRLDVPFDSEIFEYLMDKHYRSTDRPMRRCHPRDLLESLTDFCSYKRKDSKLSRELIDRVSRSYFPDNVVAS